MQHDCLHEKFPRLLYGANTSLSLALTTISHLTHTTSWQHTATAQRLFPCLSPSAPQSKPRDSKWRARSHVAGFRLVFFSSPHTRSFHVRLRQVISPFSLPLAWRRRKRSQLGVWERHPAEWLIGCQGGSLPSHYFNAFTPAAALKELRDGWIYCRASRCGDKCSGALWLHRALIVAYRAPIVCSLNRIAAAL